MNKAKWMKWLLPVAVLGIGAAGMASINATAGKTEESEPVDTRPSVRVMAATSITHQVTITSFGEVEPLEKTMLAAQVAGEIVSWNPKFVAGGLFKQGELLFTIEQDTYQAALLQAQANLSQAKAALIEEEALAQVAKREAERLSDRKVSDLYLRKPQVLSAKANVQSATAALRLAERDLANCEVRAPYDALVISRDLGVGQFVHAGDTIAELSSIETAEVVFPIPGFDSAFVPLDAEGIAATVTTQGRRKISREATIARDLGIVDNATRMSHLVVRINDPYSLNSEKPPLKFGSYVSVSFAGKQLAGVFEVPQDLVSNRILWVVDDEMKLQPRNVNVLREEGSMFLIDQGLNENDSLVMTPPEYPQTGMEVKIIDSDTEVAQR
ncbi:efflux RND transporter periplasmic adaptor subunit [Neiella marina]|uniref:Efflux RND transporter periplasmic adaptor subunit n=1 Tax=Neiella holothuriorum TaxID=2870530 RepID=A0ABS7EBR3_9GAMM|nr:efflux RND transporter periplasmic adaptor subunit [Neiella holothuriorum]MBW8189680.1 efflux RND transporter periplasmic adaptor subunit [Neiella holothuriorum]